MELIGVLGLTVALLMSIQAYADDEKEGKDTSSALLGSYTLVAGEKNGQKIPVERVQRSTARIGSVNLPGLDQYQTPRPQPHHRGLVSLLPTTRFPAKVEEH